MAVNIDMDTFASVFAASFSRAFKDAMEEATLALESKTQWDAERREARSQRFYQTSGFGYHNPGCSALDMELPTPRHATDEESVDLLKDLQEEHAELDRDLAEYMAQRNAIKTTK